MPLPKGMVPVRDRGSLSVVGAGPGQPARAASSMAIRVGAVKQASKRDMGLFSRRGWLLGRRQAELHGHREMVAGAAVLPGAAVGRAAEAVGPAAEAEQLDDGGG